MKILIVQFHEILIIDTQIALLHIDSLKSKLSSIYAISTVNLDFS